MIKSIIRLIAKIFKYQICPCCKTINPKNKKYCITCGRIIEMPLKYEDMKIWEKKYYGRK